MSSASAIKQETTVNGIEIESVKALIETVKQDSREGLTQWKVTSAWEGGTHTRARVESFNIGAKTVKRPFIIDIDEPLEWVAATPIQIRRNI
jgi:hypothetical protein